jgi:hypothetical protein
MGKTQANNYTSNWACKRVRIQDANNSGEQESAKALEDLEYKIQKQLQVSRYIKRNDC